MRSAPALASAILLAIIPLTSAAVRTCWGYDGKSWANNVQCEGSSACCGKDGICLPNKLCNTKKDGTGSIVRGPCAIQPYDPELCAEICLYDEIDNYFPRVTICESNGKYCCNNDPDCCDEGRGVVLNAKGNVVKESSTTSKISASTGLPSALSSTPSQSDSSTTSTTSTASTASTASPESTKPSTPTADSETIDSSQPATFSETAAAAGGLATGAKIGIGVAVPVAVLAAAGLGAFLWFRRRKRVYSTNDAYKPAFQETQVHELGSNELQEMQGFRKDQSNIPIEMPADESAGMKPAKVDYKPYVRGA